MALVEWLDRVESGSYGSFLQHPPRHAGYPARALTARRRIYLGVETALGWLGRHHPRAYRLARPPWRRALRLLGRPSYWDTRSHYRYYQEALRLAREHVPEGGRVIDVGSHDAELLDELSWFRSRVALDLRYARPRPGIEAVVADFREYEPDGVFDLVLCLQVLEHVPEAEPFARKLLRTGRTVIVSVPYRWPADASDAHVHDPVDEAKLREWVGVEPVEASIVDDGKPRLVAVYAGDRSASSSSTSTSASTSSSRVRQLTIAGRNATRPS